MPCFQGKSKAGWWGSPAVINSFNLPGAGAISELMPLSLIAAATVAWMPDRRLGGAIVLFAVGTAISRAVELLNMPGAGGTNTK